MTDSEVRPPSEPLVASCGLCPWQILVFTDEEKQRKETTHTEQRHPEHVPTGTVERPVQQIATVDWWNRAIDAIASQPPGSVGTLYEWCAHVPEPLNPKSQWGQLARDAEHLSLIKHVGYTQSKRPETKGSATGMWERTHVQPPRHERRPA